MQTKRKIVKVNVEKEDKVNVEKEEKITMFSAIESLLMEIEDSCMAYRDSLESYLNYISDPQGINTIQSHSYCSIC